MNTVLPNDFSSTGRNTNFETMSLDYWEIPPPPYSPPARRAHVDQYLDGQRHTGNIRHSISTFRSTNVHDNSPSPICPSSCRHTCQYCSEASIFSLKFTTGPFLIVFMICFASNVFSMSVLIGRMGTKPNACHALVNLDHAMQMWNYSQHQNLLLFKYEKEVWAGMLDEEQLRIMNTLSQIQELQREFDQDRMDWTKERKQRNAEDRHDSKCSPSVDMFVTAVEPEGAETCSAYELKDHRANIKDEAYWHLNVNDVTRLQLL